jgi:hypothetical protein
MNPTPATVATPGYLAGTWKAGSGTPGRRRAARRRASHGDGRAGHQPEDDPP